MLAVATITVVPLAFSGDNRHLPPGAPVIEGQPTPIPEPKMTVVWYQTPNEAVQAALSDLLTMPYHRWRYIRYIWHRNGSIPSAKVTSLVLNKVGRRSDPYLPPIVAGGYLTRVELDIFYPNYHLSDGISVWEKLQYDNNFAENITKDTIKFAEELGIILPKRKVTKQVKVEGWRTQTNVLLTHRSTNYARFTYPDDSGRTIDNIPPGNYFWHEDLKFKTTEFKEVVEELAEIIDPKLDVVRLDNPSINPATFLTLQSLTGSYAPVVEDSYFKFRALRQIKNLKKDNVVFTTIWGGLYYEFIGVRKSNTPGVTDQDLFFQDFLGIGNIKGGLGAKELFDRIPSEFRFLITHSKVASEQPRIVIVDPTLAGKYNINAVEFTLDIENEDVDFGDRAYENLLNPRFRAQELIAMRSNGTTYDLALNGQGVLQDEVPFDIAPDTGIPGAYSKRLQPASSCFDCHQRDGSEYWKPLKNDALRLLGDKRPEIDIIGDISQRRKAFSLRTNEKIARLYTGNPISANKVQTRLREDIAQGTLDCTGPWEGDSLNKNICKTVADLRFKEESEYWYDRVGAKEALQTLGLDVPSDKALDVFKMVIVPDLRPNLLGYLSESPTIADLKSGGRVARTDWELIQTHIQQRTNSLVTSLRRTMIQSQPQTQGSNK